MNCVPIDTRYLLFMHKQYRFNANPFACVCTVRPGSWRSFSSLLIYAYHPGERERASPSKSLAYWLAGLRKFRSLPVCETSVPTFCNFSLFLRAIFAFVCLFVRDSDSKCAIGTTRALFEQPTHSLMPNVDRERRTHYYTRA